MAIITKKENLRIKVDYLSMVVENYSAEDFIIRALDMPPEIFIKKNGNVQHKTYTTKYQLGGISIFGDIPPNEDNPKGLGCYLEMSGKGCTDFFRYHYPQIRSAPEKNTPLRYGAFFKSFNQYFLRLDYHITRLDIAIDDRNPSPYFTIEQLYKKCEKDEFISRSQNFELIKSNADESHMAQTLYIGDGKSNVRYRFYDKDLEQYVKYGESLEKIGSWKRTEIQFRKESAHAFAQEMAKQPEELGKLIAGFLGTSLRFVVPDRHQTNKSRWKTCRFWERFLGKIEPLKLEITPPDNSLYDTEKWMKEGGVLAAIKLWQVFQEHNSLGDLDDLATMMNDVQFSPELSAKAAAHLCNIGRQDIMPIIHENTKRK